MFKETGKEDGLGINYTGSTASSGFYGFIIKTIS
jgi:hypothetical protein